MKLARYAKAIAAALAAGLLAAQTAIHMSEQVRGWVTVSIAVLGAITVYAVPNAKVPDPRPDDNGQPGPPAGGDPEVA